MPKRLIIPVSIGLAFWALGLVLYHSTGYIQPLVLFNYLGTAIGLGLGTYAVLPRDRKPLGRRLSLVLVGAALFGGVAIAGQENMQLEGFFIGLVSGVFQAAVIHYVVAKLMGPLLFGRLWCGWACWTVMVLDWLPFQRSPGRLPARWGALRNAHFALSGSVVLILWFGLRRPLSAAGPTAVVWFLVGNVAYYIAAIALAYRLQDNRAFCKYLCPVTVPLKLGAGVSLLKVAGDTTRCTKCGACTASCPMDIRVDEYVRLGRRVCSTECVLCQTCISACPVGVLRLSVGFDTGRELLRESI